MYLVYKKKKYCAFDCYRFPFREITNQIRSITPFLIVTINVPGLVFSEVASFKRPNSSAIRLRWVGHLRSAC